jgi:enamine deaminase RidA (YjgF/YER057c/UK114 family)
MLRHLQSRAAHGAPHAAGRFVVASNIRFLNPDTLYKPPGYSHVVETTGPGRTVYIAGQLGLDKTGNLVGAPGDFRAQAVQTMENLKAALAAVGADFTNVVKVTNLLVDIGHLSIFREVRTQYLDHHPDFAARTRRRIA